MESAKWRIPYVIGICGLLGVLIVSLHLNDAVWQDEAYSLINFSMRGWLYPFTDYHLPNNHILLSSFMSYWWSPNDALWHLRLPMFLSFIIGIVVLGYASARQFGAVAAMAVILFYSLSSITPQFALQLRGYGLSWFFVSLLLWATPNFMQHGRALAGVIYLWSNIALVALLPTNLIVCAVFVAWGGALLLDGKHSINIKIRRFLFIALVPLLGGIAYLGVLPQLMLNSRLAFSGWGRLEVYGELMRMLVVEFWIFLPLMAIGIWCLWRQSRREHQYSQFGLILAVILVPFLLLFVFKNSLFPRSLVPLLPLFCVTGGILVQQGSRFIGANTDSKAMVLILGLAAIVMATRSVGMSCSAVDDPLRPGNLCRQYFQFDYKPEPIIEFLLTHRSDGRPVVAGYESYYALGFLNVNHGLGLDLIHYTQFPQVAPHLAPWIVLGRDDKFSALQAVAPAARYVQVLDSGYFKLYRPAEVSETSDR